MRCLDVSRGRREGSRFCQVVSLFMVHPTITAGAGVSQDEHLLPADSQAQKLRALGMSETQIMIIWFLNVYLLCTGVFIPSCMWRSSEARKGCQMLWSWSYRQVWAA